MKLKMLQKKMETLFHDQKSHETVEDVLGENNKEFENIHEPQPHFDIERPSPTVHQPGLRSPDLQPPHISPELEPEVEPEAFSSNPMASESTHSEKTLASENPRQIIRPKSNLIMHATYIILFILFAVAIYLLYTKNINRNCMRCCQRCYDYKRSCF